MPLSFMWSNSHWGFFSLPETFWKNPQFQLILREQDLTEEEDEDEDDDDEDDEVEMTPEEKKRAEKQKQKAKQCTVLVELLQKNRRQRDKVHFLFVAFHVYKVRNILFIQHVGSQLLHSSRGGTQMILCISSDLQVPPEVSICRSILLSSGKLQFMPF